MAQRSDAVTAALSDLHGRTVSWFRLDGGKHRGAIGVAEGDALERAVRLGVELGVPIVGAIATSGADVGEGVASLHAWGRVARALTDASGVVPTLLSVVGPCVSGPALMLGLVDQVVMTSDAFADVSDDGSFFELRGRHAPNLVTGLARLGGRPVGVVANQPSQRAGTLDVTAAQKGARFVQWCDAFNVPLLTFVDTTGFEPGTDLEWRGNIPHGGQPRHAPPAPPVPRRCVVVRKADAGAGLRM